MEYFLNLNKIVEEESTYGMTLVYACLLREASTDCLKIMEGAASSKMQAQETTLIAGNAGRNHYYKDREASFFATYQANIASFYQSIYGVDIMSSAKYFHCDKPKNVLFLDIPMPPREDGVILHDILVSEKDCKSSKPEAGNNESTPLKKRKIKSTEEI
jgi:hypothetical protein